MSSRRNSQATGWKKRPVLLPKDTVHPNPIEEQDVRVQVRKPSASQPGREDSALWQEQRAGVLQQVTFTPPAPAAATGTTTIAINWLWTRNGDNAQQLFFGFMERVSDSKNPL